MMFYSNSGSDANEVAFKLIRQYHQQNGKGTAIKSLLAIGAIMAVHLGH